MIQVLYLDDEEDLLDIGKTFLELSGDLEVDTSLTVKDAEARLAKNMYDAIISDYQMPLMNGIEFLKKLRSQGNGIPFILFTGKGREEVVIEALNEGADFYLQKGGNPKAQFAELEHKVKKSVLRRRADDEKAAAIEMLKLINQSKGRKELIQSVLSFISQWTGCDACGVRLRDGNDYPYYETIGFSKDLRETERPLCDRDAAAMHLKSSTTSAPFNCMCANVIFGRFDPKLPFFTKSGSFWSNRTTDLASSKFANWPLSSGNRCLAGEYASMALIPLTFGSARLGLIQINYRQRDMLDPDAVATMERLAGNLAVALAKLHYEEALSESEQKYSKAFYASANPKSLSRFNDGTFIEVNDRFLNALDLSKEEMIGHSALDLNIWVDPKCREEVIRRIRSGEQVFDKDVKFRKKDGSVIDVLYSGQALFLGGEEILQSSFIDITERKKAEEMLRRDDRRNRALFELTQIADLSPTDIAEKVMNLCIEITNSRIGYVAFLNEDETVVSMQHFSSEAMKECRMEKKSMVFKMECTGLWTEAVRKRTPVITNDYCAPNPMKKGLPSGHVALTRHMSVPVIDGGHVVAVMGVGNKGSDYTEQDALDLSLLMNDMWRIVRKIEAERALRESREAYLQLINSSPDIIVQTDMDGNIVLVNDRVLRIGGYSKEETIGKKLTSFIAPEDVEKAVANLGSIIAGKHEPTRYRLLTKEGSKVPFESNGEVLRDENGAPIGLVFVGRDITERLKAEDDLAKSETKFRTFIETSTDGVSLADTDGRIIEWNPSMEEITGIPKHEALGRYSWEIQERTMIRRAGFVPDSRTLKILTIDALKSGQAPFFNKNQMAEIQRTDGSIRRLEQTVFPIPAVSGYRIGIITRDVTDARKAEEMVHESEEKFRSIFNSTNDSIYIHDLKGRFCEANDVFCKKLGYSSEEIMGMDLEQIYPASIRDLLNNKRKEVTERGSVVFEGFHVTKDGRQIPVEINAKVFDYQGRPAFLSVARDTTERKKAEEALTQANKKLNLMTQITRHDMANQLTLIAGYVELIKNSKDHSELMMWQKKIERTLGSLDRQLEFSKQYQDLGVKEPIWQNLHELVVRSKSHLSLGSLKLVEESTDVQVLADPLLEKVVLNLIDNAIRHSHGNQMFIRTETDGDGLKIIFTDDGVGLSEDDRQHIFERGYGKNTGFGLFMSREILGITHAEIREASSKSEGARFEILIPSGYHKLKI